MSDDERRPRVGVGALMIDADGRVLLAKRRRMPEAGCWGLLGGKVEAGEDCPAAAAREIAEEIGVRIDVGRLVCVSELIDPDGAWHWIAPVYAAEIVDGAPAICEPEALSDWGWFDRDDLPAPLTQAAKDALAAL